MFKFLTVAIERRTPLWQLTKKDVQERYQGSIFGLGWAILNTVMMLLVYYFVFGFVLKARWSVDGSAPNFALVLFVGLILHGLLSDCINRAPALILSKQSYVTKMVFPLEILSWMSLYNSLAHLFVGLLIWIVFALALGLELSSTALLFPLVLPSLVLFSLGFSWLFSSLGVYFRDVSQVTGVLSTLLLFLAPILYPLTLIPEEFRWLMYLNPLTIPIEEARKVLIWGTLPDGQLLATSTLIAFLFAWSCFSLFQKARKGFADVL